MIYASSAWKAGTSWGLKLGDLLSSHFPYNFVAPSFDAQNVQDAELFSPLAPTAGFNRIRATAFSFFKDGRFGPHTGAIQLTSQIGGDSWKTLSPWTFDPPGAENPPVLYPAARSIIDPSVVYRHTEPYGGTVYFSKQKQRISFWFDPPFFNDVNNTDPAIKKLFHFMWDLDEDGKPKYQQGPHNTTSEYKNTKGKSFIDAAFTINKPFVEIAYQESFGEKSGISDPVSIKAHYNFYLQPYEKITKELLVEGLPLQEMMLPNLYAIMVDAENTDNVNYKFKHADNWQYANKVFTLTAPIDANHLSYQTAIQSPWLAAQAGDKSDWAPLGKMALATANGTPKGVDTHNEYLNKFAMRLEEAATTTNSSLTHPGTAPPAKNNKYKTIGISAHKIKDFMGEADRIKKFFPMHVDIDIPAANGGKIGKVLHESQVFDQFMQLMIAAMHPQRNKWHTPSTFQAAIVKKDAFIKKEDSDENSLSGWKDSFYSEHLTKLQLNEFLQHNSMPDMDSYTSQAPNGFLLDLVSAWKTVKNKPPTFNKKSTVGKAVMEAMAKLNDNFPEWWDAQGGTPPWAQKPVIFGKKQPFTVPWIANIKWMATKNKINKLIKENTRSVHDIYAGDYAYSEVLFYEVVKYSGAHSSGQETFIQNIFLPNAPGVEALKYVDTQIKFGKEYYYQVYAHTFVVGTQYELKDDLLKHMAPTTAGIKYFQFNYEFAPKAYLIRTPYYNTSVTMEGALSLPAGYDPVDDPAVSSGILHTQKLEKTPIWDKPPVFPDINFLPLSGERNKILLNANFNIGEYDLEPLSMLTGKEEQAKVAGQLTEEEKILRIRKNQRKLEGPITFRGDDFCGQIEVLRIENKPFSYADFSPTSNSIIAILGGSSAFGYVDDTLEPNKDYYYTARARDVHGNHSNPSPIYHVRIVAKEGEAPYAVIEMFWLEEVEEKRPITRKNLMKYIKIQPSFNQTYLDEESLVSLGSTDALNEGELLPNIGQPQIKKTVFGEKFKFRFTSKKTGKRFDLNLTIKNPSLVAGENKTTKGEQNEYSSGKC